MSSSRSQLSSQPSSQSDTTTLANLRTHLNTLASTLSNIQQLLLSTPSNPSQAPLPHYPHLTTSLNYASYHLIQIANTIASNPALNLESAVYPLPNFGISSPLGERKGEAVLSQLLRGKLDEDVLGWISAAGRVGANETKDTTQSTSTSTSTSVSMSMADRRALWESAKLKSEEETTGIPRGWDYSVEEVVNGVANVRTGIKRQLYAGGLGDEDEDDEDDESDDDDDDDDKQDEKTKGDKMDVDKSADMRRSDTVQTETLSQRDERHHAQEQNVPPMPLEDVLRFMTRGELPERSGSGLGFGGR